MFAVVCFSESSGSFFLNAAQVLGCNQWKRQAVGLLCPGRHQKFGYCFPSFFTNMLICQIFLSMHSVLGAVLGAGFVTEL